MSNNLEQFAVLHSQLDWAQYKNDTRGQVTKSNPHMVHLSFPRGPSGFPCLAASTLIDESPATAGAVCECRITCCFVYADDAKLLLSAQSQLEASIVPPAVREAEVKAMATAYMNQSDFAEGILEIEDEEGEYIPTQTGILMLALASELEDVGALKRKQLLEAIDRVEKWMIDNRDDNAEDEALSSVLRRMWRDKDAG